MMDKVLAQLDDHFVRLMRNWARATAGINPFSMTTAYTGMMGRDAYDSGIPVMRGEVVDVDMAFQVVPHKERNAVQMYWLWEGKSYVWLAGKLECSDKTVVQRCIDGHVWLKAELLRRRQMAGQLTKYMNAC